MTGPAKQPVKDFKKKRKKEAEYEISAAKDMGLDLFLLYY